MSDTPSKFLFTALDCEAKPLIAHFGLIKLTEIQPFTIYRNNSLCLTVTGVGKPAMAAGVAFTLAKFTAGPSPILLNIGVAGHKSFALCEIFVADKISDADSGRNFYPQLVFDVPCQTNAITTVSKPQFEYRQDSLYDMEASAFFETAAKFTSGELIQCLKVISDNECSPASKLQDGQVAEWIKASIATLEELLGNMRGLAQTLDTVDNDYYQTYLQQWHFTVSGQLKLKKLINRWLVLTDGQQPNLSDSRLKSGKQVLSRLEQQIADIEFTL